MIGSNAFCLLDRLGQDAPSVYRGLREAGIEVFEPMVVPLARQKNMPAGIFTLDDAAERCAQAREAGLVIPSVHMSGSMGDIPLPAFLALRCIRKLHAEAGIDTFVFSGMFRNAAGAKRWARYLKKLAAKAPAGCRLLYHNHSQESTKVEDNKTALDLMLELCGREIGLQLDIGWAGIGGDEVRTAEKYADRIISLHLKDFFPGTREAFGPGNMPKDRFCPIGAGEIRTKEVLALIDKMTNFSGVIILDQDHSTGDILCDLAQGRENVLKMLREAR